MGDRTTQGRSPAKRGRLTMRLEVSDLRRIEKVARWQHTTSSDFVREATMTEVSAAEGRGTRRAEEGSPSPASRLSDDERLALHEMTVAVNRVGANLNQVARAANRGLVDLGELDPVLDELRGECRRVVELLGGAATP